MKFFDFNSLIAQGLAEPGLARQYPFQRIPDKYKESVRQKLWDLSQNSAGVSITFETDSPKIFVYWKVKLDFKMNHMPNTGIKGLDLYENKNNSWYYCSTGIPTGKDNEAVIFKSKKSKLRKFKLHLPLYDIITDFKIGINNECEFSNYHTDSKTIVFYGTSITQGGCASRPGIAYTNIISRNTDYNCINLGFSGNGHLEASIGLILSKIKSDFYVIDCLPNVDMNLIKSNVIPLIKSIRSSFHSINKPIVFVEQPDCHNNYIEENVYKKNNTLKEEVQNALKIGHEKIYLINSKGCLGNDNEATVDGIHYNDIGFARFARHLIKNLKKLDICF